jgi:hypothetical protein
LVNCQLFPRDLTFFIFIAQEDEDEEEKWYQEFRRRRGIVVDVPGPSSRRLHRVESFSSGSQNLRFFKDFSRISQMSLSRLSKYNSYSALSDDDDCSASEDCTSQDFSRSSMSSLVKSASINYFPRNGRSGESSLYSFGSFSVSQSSL